MLDNQARRRMLIFRHNQQGVTLVELMIGLVIVGMLFAVGVPAYSSWIQNQQIRTAAESILNGLQLARSSAVTNNADVRFSLTDPTGAVTWTVGCITVTTNCPAVVQSRSGNEGGTAARAGIGTTALAVPIPATFFNTALAAGAGLPAGVTFNGLGRVLPANAGTDITWIDVTNSNSANARRMIITVGTGGRLRMCDPSSLLAANDPRHC
jgi:type IV fimbrial biogenesis protein FimT